jgi:LPS export ABC transporter protein LptC
MRSRGQLLFLVCSLLTVACEEKIKPSVLPSVDSRTLPQQESWNSNITISDSGRVRAVIDAGYIRMYESNKQTEMSQGVVVHFFDQHGHETSVLTSEEGTVDEGTNNLAAFKNVVVRSENKSRLMTEKLYWDNQKQLIHTPDFVRMTSPKEKLQGHGFESDQSLRNYRIFRATGESTQE